MDSKIKVLIGDDSAEYGIACASSLRAAGLYVITRRKDGRTLVDAIQHDAPDVVIVDAVLPNLDAMELMRRVRSGTGKQPYFIVTSAYDRVRCILFYAEAVQFGDAGTENHSAGTGRPERTNQRDRRRFGVRCNRNDSSAGCPCTHQRVSLSAGSHFAFD